MKTGFDATDDVFQHLRKNNLQSQISGLLRVGERPASSKKEDVIINSLALTASQLQKGVINVNVHVPNLTGLDNSQPNLPRLSALTRITVDLLTDIYGYDYNFTVQTPGNPIKDNDGSWYSNIRVAYYSIKHT